MVTEDGEWHWYLVENLLLESILLRLAAVKCPLWHFSTDGVRWAATISGKFTMRSAYEIRNGIEEGPIEDVWYTIQHFQGEQHMKIFLWLMCCNKIMTNQERARRHFTTDASSHICGSDIEDVDHNRVIFGDDGEGMRQSALQRARSWHLKMQQALGMRSDPPIARVRKEPRPEHWILPSLGWVKLNTDGASRLESMDQATENINQA
ncbi:hypothetical protein V6N12_031036 [Hibiscus sabdariffa]|uniref:Reverse transcriptase zinc-binding domain-containing protein n=1 Tax=Hibiscus sabdariffa TaxID=183260 RepID=A0ABR2E9J9_9ROSI